MLFRRFAERTTTKAGPPRERGPLAGLGLPQIFMDRAANPLQNKGMKTTLATVFSILVAVATQAEIYEGTWDYPGNFAVGPTSLAGGDRFVLDVDYEVQFRIELIPFQSVRFDSVTITATPGVYELPGFGGNVAVTLDSFTASFSSPSIDLNPAVGGKFALPKSTELLGTATFGGHWDNYNLQSDVMGSIAARFGQRFQDMFILPGNDPTHITLQLEDFYGWKGSNAAPSTGPALAATDVFGLVLEPQFQLERFELPSQLPCCDSGFIDIVLRSTAFLPGDANGDGAVDGTDFGIWNTNKFTSVSGGTSQADFNGDGSVDGTDFGIWNANKFTSLAGNHGPGASVGPAAGVGLGAASAAWRTGSRPRRVRDVSPRSASFWWDGYGIVVGPLLAGGDGGATPAADAAVNEAASMPMLRSRPQSNHSSSGSKAGMGTFSIFKSPTARCRQPGLIRMAVPGHTENESPSNSMRPRPSST